MTDEDMARILEEDPSPVHVILAHDKPRGSNPRWNRKNIEPCIPNQDRLQRAVEALNPKYFFHGHLHYAYVDDVLHSTTVDEGPSVTRVVALMCDPTFNPYGKWPGHKSWCVYDTDRDVEEGPGDFRFLEVGEDDFVPNSVK